MHSLQTKKTISWWVLIDQAPVHCANTLPGPQYLVPKNIVLCNFSKVWFVIDLIYSISIYVQRARAVYKLTYFRSYFHGYDWPNNALEFRTCSISFQCSIFLLYKLLYRVWLIGLRPDEPTLFYSICKVFIITDAAFVHFIPIAFLT